MVDNRSEVTNLYDTATQNCIRILDELTKAHPQYTQSVSNLQLDYVAAQRISSRIWFQLKSWQQVTGTFQYQHHSTQMNLSSEITENTVSALRINNQVSISRITARANLL
jgi:hypothetical protein